MSAYKNISPQRRRDKHGCLSIHHKDNTADRDGEFIKLAPSVSSEPLWFILIFTHRDIRLFVRG